MGALIYLPGTPVSALKKLFTVLWVLLLIAGGVVTAIAYSNELLRYFNPETSLLFDDSFMFIRYAKIWLLGYGEAWNISESPAYGNTSQLHFFLVLLLTALLELPVESLSALSSIIPSVIILFWLPWFCARHAVVFQDKGPLWRYGIWLGGLFPLLYWNTPWAYHSGTGMDAMLSLSMHLLLIDAVLTFAKQRKNSYFVAICILAYLAYLARPDNLLAAGLFPVLYLGLVLKLYRQAFIFMLVMGSAVIVDGMIKYAYFGDYFPLAYYSKRIGFLENYGFLGEIYSSPFRTFFIFLLAIFPFLVPAGLSLRQKNLLSMTAFLLPPALTIGYYFTMVAVMNYGGRYFFPFLPYFIACAVVHWPEWAVLRDQVLRSNTKSLVLRVGLLLAIYGLFLLGDKYNYEIAGYFLPKEKSICDDNNLRSSPKVLPRHTGAIANGLLASMLEQAPTGVKIAMTEHGYVGAVNPQVHIIDLAGLHNHFLAHEGFTAHWLFEQQPDAIWMGHWHYTCLNSSILDAQEFWDRYEFYPHLFSWGFALRKDSPHYPAMHALVESTWHELYPELEMSEYRRAGPLPHIDYAGNERLIRAYQEKVQAKKKDVLTQQ